MDLGPDGAGPSPATRSPIDSLEGPRSVAAEGKGHPCLVPASSLWHRTGLPNPGKGTVYTRLCGPIFYVKSKRRAKRASCFCRGL